MPTININFNYKFEYGSEYSYHGACHLFSSLLIDTDIFYNEPILALSFDGGSDIVLEHNASALYNYIGAYSNQGKIEYFPIMSPGKYWTYAKKILQRTEGNLMALAYASESRSYESLYGDVDIIESYNAQTDEQVYTFVNKIISTIFSYSENDCGEKFNYFDKRFNNEENKISMIMKIIQELSLNIVDNIIDYALAKYNIKKNNTYIAISGGYGLNCPTNTHIMHKYCFKGQLIPPCANDSGQSIGMALLYFYSNMDKFNFNLKTSYYGDTYYSLDDLSSFQKYIVSVEQTRDKFIDDIIEAPILWFDGRAEIGPRALGHRSILADPRSITSKDLLNIYKQREWWRPVAPIVLEEEVNKWFKNSYKSPFMLNNFVINDQKEHLVPAILHLDRTARVQTISEIDNDLLYNQLKKFHEKTGVPIICNTSLNDKGEPIINTLSQVINFALRKEIKILYYNGYRIEFNKHKEFYEKEPDTKNDFIIHNVNEIQDSNPYGIDLDEYALIKYNNLFKTKSLKDAHNVKISKRMIKKIKIISTDL